MKLLHCDECVADLVSMPSNWSFSVSGKKDRYNSVRLSEGGKEYMDIKDAFMKSKPNKIIAQVRDKPLFIWEGYGPLSRKEKTAQAVKNR